MISKMKTSSTQLSLCCFIILISFSFIESSSLPLSTISFTTLGRSSYAFDIYALPINGPSDEIRLTDGISVNFNGHFPSSSSLSMLLPNRPDPKTHLIYVTERNGSSSIYLDALYETPIRAGSRSILDQGPTRLQVLLVGDEQTGGGVSMKDKPSLVGQSLIYVSTHENPGKRGSWTAVYSTHLITGLTQRLTPKGVADYGPAVSPSGKWTAVASCSEKGCHGIGQELGMDIYLFLTRDGSNRVKLIENGGWPSFVDDSTLYFHRECEDGWWSVFKASFDIELGVESVVTQRVTPPGLHAFTPSASVANKSIIAVATRRPGSEYRHIELYNVVLNKFIDLTRSISPNAHHFNPFISPDSAQVGYHKCRGTTNNLILENVRSPIPGISMFRVDGYLPSYSPDGERIAYVDFSGLYVMNSDGSGIRRVYSGNVFTTAWDWKRKGVVYTSSGPDFASESTRVDIISINVDDEELSYKKLTTSSENNAFPSPSPDGKWVVFRSGRSGHKNLYIMDALDGETGGIYRLTEGPWTDTTCNWSPDGEWIIFTSNRENQESNIFELFKIHPNGTGLQKLIESGLGGLTAHPYFSPDGKYVAFASNYAGLSAELLSNPLPFGDIFVMRSDGSEMQRMSHNSYEDGSPAWSPKYIKPINVERPDGGSKCSFPDIDAVVNTTRNERSSNHCSK